MKKFLLFFLFTTILMTGLFVYIATHFEDRSATSMKGFPVDPIPEDLDPNFDNWKRPDGPPRIGLQIGHLENDQVPEELNGLKGNTGAVGGGSTEVEVAENIAMETKRLLEEKGVTVDILPATIPEKYWADAFIAIHADGSEDTSKTGYKFAGPRRDYTGKVNKLVSLLEEKYEEITGLPKDTNITRNMRGYYAFSWWRYDHAIHPMTPGAIAETGFMTNRSDRNLLINNPEVPANALAQAIIEFLASEKLL